MRRRDVLLGLGAAAGGCASLPPPIPEIGPVTPPTIPPPPVPPPPGDAAGYRSGPYPVLQPTGDGTVDAWIARVLQEGGPGWRPFLLRAFDGVRADPLILSEHEALEAARPRTAAELMRAVVTPERVAEGRRRLARRRAADAKVPPEVLLAIWGAESDYGGRRPRHDVIQVLAMLGGHGLGRSWAAFDIYSAAAMLAERRVGRGAALAYADGRMGQIGWFPDTYRRWSADGDGDGRADIWGSEADIFASLAAAMPAWEPGRPWAVEVIAPPLDPGDPAHARRAAYRPVRDVSRADGREWSDGELQLGGELVAPFGPSGPAFLTFRNLFPIASVGDQVPSHDQDMLRAWGLAVGQLANEIAGASPLSRPVGQLERRD